MDPQARCSTKESEQIHPPEFTSHLSSSPIAITRFENSWFMLRIVYLLHSFSCDLDLFKFHLLD